MIERKISRYAERTLISYKGNRGLTAHFWDMKSPKEKQASHCDGHSIQSLVAVYTESSYMIKIKNKAFIQLPAWLFDAWWTISNHMLATDLQQLEFLFQEKMQTNFAWWFPCHFVIGHANHVIVTHVASVILFVYDCGHSREWSCRGLMVFRFAIMYHLAIMQTIMQVYFVLF